jgi:hypothetical protein
MTNAEKRAGASATTRMMVSIALKSIVGKLVIIEGVESSRIVRLNFRDSSEFFSPSEI